MAIARASARREAAVIGETGGSAGGKGAKVVQLPAGHAFGDVGAAVETDRKRAAPLKNIIQYFGRIYRGLRVGHQNDGGIAALHRGLRAGGEIFLVSKTGIAEMGVRVDESRADDHAGRVQDRGAGGSHQVFIYFDKAAVVDQNVPPAFGAGGGIDQITVLD